MFLSGNLGSLQIFWHFSPFHYGPRWELIESKFKVAKLEYVEILFVREHYDVVAIFATLSAR